MRTVTGSSFRWLELAAVFMLFVIVQISADETDLATSADCYYNYNHYSEGDRILTNEPCLNCTCHNKMLMCYLKVCPFTKPIGQDCTIEKREDQCCPIITCPEVHVELDQSTQSSTDLATNQQYGCSIDDEFFAEGAQVPGNPKKPCELCYCIRNMTSCVMQECTLHVDGCRPIYNKGVCCPVRYDCAHEEDLPLLEDTTTTTEAPSQGFVITTTSSPARSTDCSHNNERYIDGELIETEHACEHCYCMRGDIVCAVQECKPLEMHGKNCTARPPKIGECCPSEYACDTDAERLATTLYDEPSATTADYKGHQEDVEPTTTTPELHKSSGDDDKESTSSTTERFDESENEIHDKDYDHRDSVKPTKNFTAQHDDSEESTTLFNELERIVTSTVVAEAGISDDGKLATSAPIASQSHKEPIDEQKTDENAGILSGLYTTIKSIVDFTTFGSTQDEHKEEEGALLSNVIPGEGDCLENGVSYSNDSYVPTRNICEASCRCFNSIVQCERLECPAMPPNAQNCKIVMEQNSCCPSYHCESMEMSTDIVLPSIEVETQTAQHDEEPAPGTTSAPSAENADGTTYTPFVAGISGKLDDELEGNQEAAATETDAFASGEKQTAAPAIEKATEAAQTEQESSHTESQPQSKPELSTEGVKVTDEEKFHQESTEGSAAPEKSTESNEAEDTTSYEGSGHQEYDEQPKPTTQGPLLSGAVDSSSEFSDKSHEQPTTQGEREHYEPSTTPDSTKTEYESGDATQKPVESQNTATETRQQDEQPKFDATTVKTDENNELERDDQKPEVTTVYIEESSSEKQSLPSLSSEVSSTEKQADEQSSAKPVQLDIRDDISTEEQGKATEQPAATTEKHISAEEEDHKPPYLHRPYPENHDIGAYLHGFTGKYDEEDEHVTTESRLEHSPSPTEKDIAAAATEAQPTADEATTVQQQRDEQTPAPVTVTRDNTVTESFDQKLPEVPLEPFPITQTAEDTKPQQFDGEAPTTQRYADEEPQATDSPYKIESAVGDSQENELSGEDKKEEAKPVADFETPEQSATTAKAFDEVPSQTEASKFGDEQQPETVTAGHQANEPSVSEHATEKLAEDPATEHSVSEQEPERIAGAQAVTEAEAAATEAAVTEHEDAGKIGSEQTATEKFADEHAAPEAPATEHAAPEHSATEQALPEHSATEQALPEHSATEQAVPEHSATEQAVPERSATEQAVPEHAATEQAVPEHSATEQVLPEHSATEHALPEHSATEQVLPEHSPSEQAFPEQPATEEASPEQTATEKIADEQVVPEAPATEHAAPEQSATEQAATEKYADEPASPESSIVVQGSPEYSATEKATEQTATEKFADEPASPEAPIVEQSSHEPAATEQAATEQAATEKYADEQAAPEQTATEKPQQQSEPEIQKTEAPFVPQTSSEQSESSTEKRFHESTTVYEFPSKQEDLDIVADHQVPSKQEDLDIDTTQKSTEDLDAVRSEEPQPVEHSTEAKTHFEQPSTEQQREEGTTATNEQETQKPYYYDEPAHPTELQPAATDKATEQHTTQAAYHDDQSTQGYAQAAISSEQPAFDDTQEKTTEHTEYTTSAQQSDELLPVPEQPSQPEMESANQMHVSEEPKLEAAETPTTEAEQSYVEESPKPETPSSVEKENRIGEEQPAGTTTAKAAEPQEAATEEAVAQTEGSKFAQTESSVVDVSTLLNKIHEGTKSPAISNASESATTEQQEQDSTKASAYGDEEPHATESSASSTEQAQSEDHTTQALLQPAVSSERTDDSTTETQSVDQKPVDDAQKPIDDEVKTPEAQTPQTVEQQQPQQYDETTAHSNDATNEPSFEGEQPSGEQHSTYAPAVDAQTSHFEEAKPTEGQQPAAFDQTTAHSEYESGTQKLADSGSESETFDHHTTEAAVQQNASPEGSGTEATDQQNASQEGSGTEATDQQNASPEGSGTEAAVQQNASQEGSGTESYAQPEHSSTEGVESTEGSATEEAAHPAISSTEAAVQPEVPSSEVPALPERAGTEASAQPEIFATEAHSEGPSAETTPQSEAAAQPEAASTEAQPEIPHGETSAQPDIPHAETTAQPEISHIETTAQPEIAHSETTAQPDLAEAFTDSHSESAKEPQSPVLEQETAKPNILDVTTIKSVIDLLTTLHSIEASAGQKEDETTTYKSSESSSTEQQFDNRVGSTTAAPQFHDEEKYDSYATTAAPSGIYHEEKVTEPAAVPVPPESANNIPLIRDPVVEDHYDEHTTTKLAESVDSTTLPSILFSSHTERFSDSTTNKNTQNEITEATHQASDDSLANEPAGVTQHEPEIGHHPPAYPQPASPYGEQVPSQYPDEEYTDEEEPAVFGPGTCRYGGKLYVSAQQIPRDDPCDFCFCFRSDIICLQQSCPPPINGCHEEPIQGFCCPRYECPVSMALVLNATTTTTTTLPPYLAHFQRSSSKITRSGCQIQGVTYKIGDRVTSASGPCIDCICGGDGQMKCEPKACTPEPMLRQMIAVAASRR